MGPVYHRGVGGVVLRLPSACWTLPEFRGTAAASLLTSLNGLLQLRYQMHTSFLPADDEPEPEVHGRGDGRGGRRGALRDLDRFVLSSADDVISSSHHLIISSRQVCALVSR